MFGALEAWVRRCVASRAPSVPQACVWWWSYSTLHFYRICALPVFARPRERAAERRRQARRTVCLPRSPRFSRVTIVRRRRGTAAARQRLGYLRRGRPAPAAHPRPSCRAPRALQWSFPSGDQEAHCTAAAAMVRQERDPSKLRSKPKVRSRSATGPAPSRGVGRAAWGV